MNPLWPAPAPDGTCGTCVWRFIGGRGARVDRCRRHRDARVDPSWPACPAFTPALDCVACGACCREAYHAVEVSRRDPFVRAHRDRLAQRDGRLQLPRPGGHCVCLQPDGRCDVYEERPRNCRDFEIAGPNCLEARRRVGLTG